KVQQDDLLVGICGHVKAVEKVHDKDRHGHRLSFRELAGDEEFEAYAFSGNGPLLAAAYQAVREGHLMIAFGRFATYKKGDDRYEGPQRRFELCDLRRLTRQTSLLGPTAAELAAVEALAGELFTEPG